jgi:hypothetical protein
MHSLRRLTLAGLLAAAPLAATAATVELNDGDSVDLLSDSYFFDGQFGIGDAGDTLTFTFTNNSTSSAALTLFGGTVQQTSAAFTGGVDLDFGTLVNLDLDQGEDLSFEYDNLVVGAGSSVTLTITFGNVIDTGRREGGVADIDFSVEAALVPVPAAGLLLLTALGGLAVSRRRKAA